MDDIQHDIRISTTEHAIVAADGYTYMPESSLNEDDFNSIKHAKLWLYFHSPGRNGIFI